MSSQRSLGRTTGRQDVRCRLTLGTNSRSVCATMHSFSSWKTLYCSCEDQLVIEPPDSPNMFTFLKKRQSATLF